MEVILRGGETISSEGDVAGDPIVQLDDSTEGVLMVDVRAELPDDEEDGDRRSVNVMLPWDDLCAAVEFLKGGDDE